MTGCAVSPGEGTPVPSLGPQFRQFYLDQTTLDVVFLIFILCLFLIFCFLLSRRSVALYSVSLPELVLLSVCVLHEGILIANISWHLKTFLCSPITACCFVCTCSQPGCFPLGAPVAPLGGHSAVVSPVAALPTLESSTDAHFREDKAWLRLRGAAEPFVLMLELIVSSEKK